MTRRRELARRALDGYIHGPAASTRATARALAKVDNALAVVLVEGISDQIALETLAVGRGRNLEAERVVILPIGGAHAITRAYSSTRQWATTDRRGLSTRCSPPSRASGHLTVPCRPIR